MWDYTDKVRELFLHPRNVGEVENADAVGEVGSIACGDALRLTLRVGKDGKIADAKFKTFGCASAIASSSVLTEMIIGKTLEEAGRITNRDIAAELGGLPEEKMHCSVMGMEALEAAIASYRGRAAEKMDAGEIVCKCFGVTDARIRRVIRENRLESVDQVTNYTKAGGACGSCVEAIGKLLKEELDARGKEPAGPGECAAPKRRMTTLQKINRIQEVITKDIQPMLQQDGGRIELIDVEGDKVLVSLRGMCAGCIASGATISWIQARLREFVSPAIEVIQEEG